MWLIFFPLSLCTKETVAIAASFTHICNEMDYPTCLEKHALVNCPWSYPKFQWDFRGLNFEAPEEAVNDQYVSQSPSQPRVLMDLASYFHLFTKMNPLMAWPGEHHLFSCPAFLSDIGFFPLDFDYPVLTCKVTHTRGERTISLLHCLAQGRPPQKLVSLCFTKYLVRVQTAVILTCIMEALIFP